MSTLVNRAVLKATPRSMMLKRKLREKSDKRAFVGSLLILSLLAVSFWF